MNTSLGNAGREFGGLRTNIDSETAAVNFELGSKHSE